MIVLIFFWKIICLFSIVVVERGIVTVESVVVERGIVTVESVLEEVANFRSIQEELDSEPPAVHVEPNGRNC